MAGEPAGEAGVPAARRVTSVDVARLAGVAQSTVSRALSGAGPVSPAVRERVLAAARQLGYTPDAIARSLITRRTHIVGIVMAGLSSPFQPYVLEKLIQRLGAAGQQALVFSAAPGQEVDDILPAVLEYRLDGLIITSATLSSPKVEACLRHRTPVLLFNRDMPGERVSAVCCDNVAGGRLVADALVAAGHRRFAYVAGSRNSSTNRDRERGFTERLRELGQVLARREEAAYTYESGQEAAGRLLSAGEPPDAIFCGSDIIALGVLDTIRAAGWPVPEAVSIVGFDDIPMAAWGAYALTTIRQPVDAMIEAAVTLLAERIGRPETAPVRRFFPGTLVVRRSARGLEAFDGRGDAAPATGVAPVAP